MGTRDPERTRTRLLQAATNEFAAHGYAGARVARIAKRAGANQRMVYHYFGSKEGLYEATFLRLDQDMIQRLQPILRELEDDPLKGLADAVRRYFELMRGRPDYSRLTVGETLERKRRLRYELTDRDPGYQLLPRLLPLIQRGQATGQLNHRVNIAVALAVVLFFCVTYPLLADRLAGFYDAVGVPSGDRDAFTRDQLVELMLDGIAGPKARR